MIASLNSNLMLLFPLLCSNYFECRVSPAAVHSAKSVVVTAVCLLQVSCGFNRVVASNFFGHFWLTQLLLDDLKAAAPSRCELSNDTLVHALSKTQLLAFSHTSPHQPGGSH
jgi:hypothetical protein